MKYATKADAIEQYIKPSLGMFWRDYDMDAIFSEFFTYTEGGYVPGDEGEYYEIAKSHDMTYGGHGLVQDDNGHWISYKAAEAVMDRELAEEISDRIAPCPDQRFFDEYAAAHLEKYGEDFPPYVGGIW